MKTDTREKILFSSLSLMLKYGYNNTGISLILKDANVPKGSFYHYFESKKALGVALIEASGDQQVQYLEHLLSLYEGKPAIEQLTYLFDSLLGLFRGNLDFCNCMLGNFAQELSVQSPFFREKIDYQFHRFEVIFEKLLRQAQGEGDIDSSVDAASLAVTLQSGWSGAIMRAKLVQGVEPLEGFIALYFTSIRR